MKTVNRGIDDVCLKPETSVTLCGDGGSNGAWPDGDGIDKFGGVL